MRSIYFLCVAILFSCGQDPSFSVREQGPQSDKSDSDNTATTLDEVLPKTAETPTGLVDSDDFVDTGDKLKLVSYSQSFTASTDHSNKIDVLVVVDNSISMADEHIKLSGKLAEILSALGTTDWRLGITTTDARNNGNLVELIEKKDKSLSFVEKKQLFEQTVHKIGTNGSDNEVGIPMAVRGLQKNHPRDAEQKWVRPQGSVAVLIVSDEDNCSTGVYCYPSSENRASYLTNFLSSPNAPGLGRELGVSAKVYGLIRRNPQECKHSAPYVGREYLKAITASSGMAGSICDDDYGPVLHEISKDIAQHIDIGFELDQTPYEENLAIYVDGKAFQGSYRLEGNKVYLLWDDIDEESEIAISYQYIP
jgi:hypothetical protein